MQAVTDARSESFTTEFERMMAVWPLQPERVKKLSAEYRRIFDQQGESRFRARVDKALSDPSIDRFPSPAVFCKAIVAKQEKITCSRCRDFEGWIRVMVDGEKYPREMKCQHDAPAYSRQAWIGPDSERKQVLVMDADYTP